MQLNILRNFDASAFNVQNLYYQLINESIFIFIASYISRYGFLSFLESYYLKLKVMFLRRVRKTPNILFVNFIISDFIIANILRDPY